MTYREQNQTNQAQFDQQRLIQSISSKKNGKKTKKSANVRQVNVFGMIFMFIL
jgi:hypothetical protein